MKGKVCTILIALFVLTACGSQELAIESSDIPESYLRVPLMFSLDESRLDPHRDWYVDDGMVFNVFFDSLYALGPDSDIIPGIASDLPEISEDGLVYKISLKEDVYFHDDPAFSGGEGRLVVADDVVYSIKRILDPNANDSESWSMIQGKILGVEEFHIGLGDGTLTLDDDLAGVKAIGEHEVEIMLEEPADDLLHILSSEFLSVLPREAAEEYGEDFDIHPVGTGPFKIVSHGSDKVVAERNEGHWRNVGENLPDGIVFAYYGDQWNAFKDGNLDLFLIDSDRLEAYLDSDFQLKEDLKEEGYDVLSVEDVGKKFIIFNFNDSLMQNLHLRKAMAYAIDWERIIDYGDTLSASFLPVVVLGYKDLQWEYNVVKARDELALAGYPDGEGLPVIKYRVCWPSRIFFSAMVEDYLEGIGIQVELEYLESECELGDAHMGTSGWGFDYPTYSYLDQLLGSESLPPLGGNYGYFQSEEFDVLVDEALDLEGEELIAHYGDITQWIYDQVVVIPFSQVYYYYGLSPRVESIDVNPVGYIIWETIQLKEE